jgi:hypothetical protein
LLFTEIILALWQREGDFAKRICRVRNRAKLFDGGVKALRGIDERRKLVDGDLG